MRPSCVSGPRREAATLSELRAAASVTLEDGAAAARRRSASLDRAIADVFSSLVDPGFTLVAVGGYGRGELSPHSDVDLLFLTSGRRGSPDRNSLRAMLYPLWDAGWRVGHAVRGPKDAIGHATGDLDAATALLQARLICGNERTWLELLDRRALWTRKEGRRLTRAILDSTAERHGRAKRAGWALAPDIKDDCGGLRDLHVVGWLSALGDGGPVDPVARGAGDLLLAVREALHGALRRPNDRLHIALQPRIADALGIAGDERADKLMAQVHSAARDIEHRSAAARSSAGERVFPGPRRSGSTHVLPGGVVLRDGELSVVDGAGASDLSLALHLLAGVAATGKAPSARVRVWLAGALAGPPIERWDRSMRAGFALMLAGPHVLDALELLDHHRGWARLLPEWLRIRGRTQHDPFHHYTVDGHSFMCVAEVTRAIADDQLAADCAREVGALGTLRLAALLHDVGKGSGDDHSVAGERVARVICRRIGLPPDELEEVCFLVRHHLLLADTATRRDLEDGAVITELADTVRDVRRLRLLYLLTIADARATGPGVWTEWKRALVATLFGRGMIALETGEVPARTALVERARQIEALEPTLAGRAAGLLGTLPPSYIDSADPADLADELKLLVVPPKPGEVRHRIHPGADGALVSLCMIDRPGTLARAAGVLSLHRIEVRAAAGFATTEGIALERFTVDPPSTTSWSAVTADLDAAFSGRLALDEAVATKIRDYSPRERIEPVVTFVPDASSHSTVVEIRCMDALGLLYALAAGISDLDLDIHVAKVDTLGPRVVDVFYVRTIDGALLDPAQSAALERSVRHRVASLFG